ncbi:unnamed protein product [Darwinula stevensoni]|uniref:Uncharacterized protein n=1 Tax=Darwinula stevensoni TaxID=69355 RepID=A0A7R8XEM2_9CRUS|nr:unnamed protein product [Darwinula stevensoni]CAG0895940.1 unnamed protein product [Darwinula stevensoni]
MAPHKAHLSRNAHFILKKRKINFSGCTAGLSHETYVKISTKSSSTSSNDDEALTAQEPDFEYSTCQEDHGTESNGHLRVPRPDILSSGDIDEGIDIVESSSEGDKSSLASPSVRRSASDAAKGTASSRRESSSSEASFPGVLHSSTPKKKKGKKSESSQTPDNRGEKKGRKVRSLMNEDSSLRCEKNKDLEYLLKKVPNLSVSGKSTCCRNTDLLYDEEMSYMPFPTSTLPSCLKNSCLLLTVTLSSNGTVAQVKDSGKSNPESTDLPFTYYALVTWLSSLVPKDHHHHKVQTECPFVVCGMQQGVVGKELMLSVLIQPNSYVKSTGAKGLSFHERVVTYLSKKSLEQVCSSWLPGIRRIRNLLWPLHIYFEDNCYEQQGHNGNPGLVWVSGPKKPMIRFVKVHGDPSEARAVFSLLPSCFWATMEDEDTVQSLPSQAFHGEGGENRLEVALSIRPWAYLSNAQQLGSFLLAALHAGLDVAGLHLIYKEGDTSSRSSNSSGSSFGQADLEPFLALVLRGCLAREWEEKFNRILQSSLTHQDAQLSFLDNHPLTCIFQSVSMEWDGNMRRGANGELHLKQSLVHYFGGPPRTLSDETGSLIENKAGFVSLLSCNKGSGVAFFLNPALPFSLMAVALEALQRHGFILHGLLPAAALVESDNPLPLWEEGRDKPSVFVGTRENAAHHLTSMCEAVFIQIVLHLVQRSEESPNVFSLKDLREVMGEEASLNRLIRPLLLSKPLSLSAENDIPPSISQSSDAWESERFYSPQSSSSTQTVGLLAFGSFILAHLDALEEDLNMRLQGSHWIQHMDMDSASYLTPFEVGHPLWEESIQTLSRRGGILFWVHGPDAHRRLTQFLNAGDTQVAFFERGIVITSSPRVATHWMRIRPS